MTKKSIVVWISGETQEQYAAAKKKKKNIIYIGYWLWRKQQSSLLSMSLQYKSISMKQSVEKEIAATLYFYATKYIPALFHLNVMLSNPLPQSPCPIDLINKVWMKPTIV